MRLLDQSGIITLINDSKSNLPLHLASGHTIFSDDVIDHETDILQFSHIRVEFVSSADGRGFSWPHQLRSKSHYEGKIYATGKINPEQVTLALQVGFDGILITDTAWSEYGETQWRDTGASVITVSYGSYVRDSIQSIWNLRSDR